MPHYPQVTCPHCWHRFDPADMKWVAEHERLLGDEKVGAHAYQRFLPERFTAEGLAIDEYGMACKELACPECHLTIPRAMLDNPPAFFSVLGTQSAGKTYFTTTMTNCLRGILKRRFSLDFGDADTKLNSVVISNENRLFGFSDGNQIIKLEKTQQTQDGHFDMVTLNGQSVRYPRPFIFTVAPDQHHPCYQHARKLPRTLCFYDNAGEDFQSGSDKTSQPVTRHLLRADAVFFVFDPTQDPNFRRQCAAVSSDPQLREGQRLYRQEQVLIESAALMTQLGHLRPKPPLIVCVAKYDAWAPLVGNRRLESDDLLVPSDRGHLSLLNCRRIREESARIKALLETHARNIVTAAENFSPNVIYIPCSALGRSPEKDFGIRPKDIRPMWIEAPILYALCRCFHDRNLVLDADRDTDLFRSQVAPPSNGAPTSSPAQVAKQTGASSSGVLVAVPVDESPKTTSADGAIPSNDDRVAEFPRILKDTGS